MSEWKSIETAPKDGIDALVFDPYENDKPIFEAIVYPNGDYYDPCYDEWHGRGATHWMPLPLPPVRD